METEIVLFHMESGVSVQVAVFLVVLVSIHRDQQDGLIVGVATLVFDFPKCRVQEGDSSAEKEIES